MLKVFSSLACLTMLVSLAYVQADELSSLAPSTCKNAQCDVVQASSCQSCQVAKAMENLPKITFAVGAEKTCCSQSAAALSKKLDKPVQYVVGDKVFSTEQLAMAALADATEKFVTAFAEPKVCSESGTVTVAGKQVCCSAVAAETTKVVKSAMDQVAMTYLVGDQACDCPKEAGSLAKETGTSLVFLVNGEQTSCEVTARLNLARAKYRAAVQALIAASPNAEDNKP